MNMLRFIVGFVAGLAEDFCGIPMRNWVLSSMRYTASTANGFDAYYSLCRGL